MNFYQTLSVAFWDPIHGKRFDYFIQSDSSVRIWWELSENLTLRRSIDCHLRINFLRIWNLCFLCFSYYPRCLSVHCGTKRIRTCINGTSTSQVNFLYPLDDLSGG